MARSMQIARASLVAIVGLAIASYLLFLCWTALQTGVIDLPVGRRRGSLVITLVRAEQPIWFLAALLVAFLVSALCMLGALWQARIFVADSSAYQQTVARSILKPLEQEAPSGLAPLWWGLLIAVAAFLLYIAF